MLDLPSAPRHRMADQHPARPRPLRPGRLQRLLGAPPRSSAAVEIAAGLDEVTVTCQGRQVARHPWCWAAHQSITDPPAPLRRHCWTEHCATMFRLCTARAPEGGGRRPLSNGRRPGGGLLMAVQRRAARLHQSARSPAPQNLVSCNLGASRAATAGLDLR
jgi:hypothetical protein